jgi:Fur family ferric uptake transcriptional regulator
MVDTDIPSATQALREAGYKLTQPRLAVLSVLENNSGCLDPHDIHRLGKKIYKRLGLVTVYRTLEILDALGVARRVHTQGQCHGYARAGGDQHYVVCRRCERVVEFPCDGLDQLIAHVCQETGYDIDEHLLELTGLCPQCRTRG